MKLKNFFKFSTTATNLIYSYLSDRSQSVHIQDRMSNTLTLTRGVLLGPLLFCLYVNDLPQRLMHCNIQMYADDVQLHLSSPANSTKEAIDNLNCDLKSIHLWASENSLCLNPRKSKCLLIHKKTTEPVLENEILINNEKIEVVKSAKNLGILFNNSLTWTNHVNSLVMRIYIKLRTLWSVQYFTPVRIRVLLAKSYLIPSLTYGCELFSSCDSLSRRKLEVLYNNIVRYVYGLKRVDHVSAYSKLLYGVSFDNLLKIRTTTFLHKIIFTKKPNYLYSKLKFAKSTRGKNIIIPKFRCLVSEWHFFISAIRLWNSLPHNQQTNSNATSFNKFLFKFFA